VSQLVFFFGQGTAEGTRDMKAVLGGKGANLAEMTNLGIPVPPGFTIACELCARYLEGGAYPAALREQVAQSVSKLEQATGRRFGDATAPLLVSVRSGSPVSMPGMMETILNLGLNDDTVAALERATGNGRFAWDSYRRFLQMYGDVVLGVPSADFEHLLTAKRLNEGVRTDAELSEPALRSLVDEYKRSLGTRGRLPDRSRTTALGRDRGGVEVVAAQEGGRLPPRERDRRQPRHGRHRAGDGLRQRR